MFANFELKYPGNSLFLLLALAGLIFFILGLRKKERIMAVIFPGYTLRFKILRPILMGLGLGLLSFALLGPQVFTGEMLPHKSGLDIYVLMDTSKSMLVQDVQPDRLGAAKNIVNNLLDQLEGDRIGFIPFGSGSYIQMPLTDDYQMARMYLNAMDTDMVGGGGTNLAAGIGLANNSFARTSGADRVILILSDGEEYHAGAGQEVLQSLVAYDAQLRVFAVGVGTQAGGRVPIYSETGLAVIDYIRDGNDQPVISSLRADTLRDLARLGHGAYYQASEPGTEAALLADLAVLQRDSLGARSFKRFQPLFQYFLAAGLLLILLAWFLPERRLAV